MTKFCKETMLYYIDKGYDWVLHRTYPMKDEEVDWNPPFKTDSALKDFRHVVTAFKKYIAIILGQVPPEFDYPDPYEVGMDECYYELEKQRDYWKNLVENYTDEEMNGKILDPRSNKEKYIGDLIFDHIIHQSDMIGHITTKRGMRTRALNIKHHGTFRAISDEDRAKIRSFKK
ncbi:MAG: DinB family protein [Candidatus Ranarchaeia archaeon]